MSAEGAQAVAERLGEAAVFRLVRAALAEAEAWVVGGAVRAAALGREVTDLDLVVSGEEGTVAAAIARAAGGHSFQLSAEFRTWRVVDRGRTAIADITPMRGGSIEEDLAGRDFTVGAIAVPLSGGAALDPHGGLADARRGVLRCVSEESFAQDPLRLLRAARLGAELELDPEPRTVEFARATAHRAAEPAGERQFAELRRILAGAAPLRGLELMDRLALTGVVLPELEALRGVEQNPNHHLDVYGHTVEVLARTLEIEVELDHHLGELAGETRALLAEPLADDLDRGAALRLGALVHDLGKPQTRSDRGGYVTFIGHDRAGSALVDRLCRRLRTSARLRAHLRSLTENHLRLGFMLAERPLGPRAVHSYLRLTEPASADVTLLSMADRLAARGEGPLASEEMVMAHLELAREIMGAALRWRREGPPRPLIGGDELAAQLGIEPGPRLGALMREIEAAQYAGEVTSAAEAVALARAARV